MKNIIIILLLTIYTINANAVNVTMKVIQSENALTKLMVGYDEYKLITNEEGIASIEVPIEQNTFATFFYSNVLQLDVYLMPDKDMEIVIDLSKEGGDINVYCDDNGINEYLLNSLTLPTIQPADFGLNIDGFYQRLEEVKEQQLNDLKQQKLVDSFKTLQEQNIVYKVSSLLLQYPRGYAQVSGNPNFNPSPTYYNLLGNLLIDNVELVELFSYRYFIENTLSVFATAQATSPLDYLKRMIELAINIQSVKIKEHMIFTQTMKYITSFGIEDAESVFNVAMNNLTNEVKLKTIKNIIGNFQRIAKGQISPSFNYKDVEGNEVTLESLKGKYVYIDCWASWCGPCIKEIPALKKLKKKFKNKNIQFVGISTDRDQEAWKKMVEKKNMEGIQLHIGSDQEFMQAFMVNSIPRFILIDKEGKIYDANAPRPSTENIIEYFNGLKGID